MKRIKKYNAVDDDKFSSDKLSWVYYNYAIPGYVKSVQGFILFSLSFSLIIHFQWLFVQLSDVLKSLTMNYYEL